MLISRKYFASPLLIPGYMDNRENLMLKLTEMARHLEYDRPQEAFEAMKASLSFYAPAEIYDKLDIELTHFLGKLCDNLPADLRSKISTNLKDLIKSHKNEASQISPSWLLDLIEVSLVRFPPSDDPRDIQHIRRLIANFPECLELKVFLATRLVQDSIDRNREEGFKESLFIFNSLYPIFNKKSERQDRFRVYFPVDPESLFNTLRVWAVLQYSQYLQIENRLSDVIDYLRSQIKEPWFMRAEENDQTAMRLELDLLEKQARISEIIGSKYENRIKKWIAVLIGAPFFVSMMGGILAGNHLDYGEVVRLVVVIALSTILIIGIVLLLLGCETKQKRPLLITITSTGLILFAFIMQTFIVGYSKFPTVMHLSNKEANGTTLSSSPSVEIASQVAVKSDTGISREIISTEQVPPQPDVKPASDSP